MHSLPGRAGLSTAREQSEKNTEGTGGEAKKSGKS